MGSIIDLFVNGWKKILVYIGIGAVLFSVGGFYGYQYRDGKAAKEVVTAVVKQVDEKEKKQEIADVVGTEVEAKKEKTRIVYKTIEKEIIRYVKENPDAGDPIGAVWVCIYNASARGEAITESTCKSDNPVP